MKKILMSALMLLLIILSNCNEDKGHTDIKISDNVYPVNYKKVREVKIDCVSKGIFRLNNYSSDRYLYLSFSNTKGDYEIWKYNLGLSLIDKFTIKHGQGPNECISPLITGGTDEEVMIYDGTVKRFYLYNWDFKSRVNIKSKILGQTSYGNYNYLPLKKIVTIAFWNPHRVYEKEFCIYVRKIEEKKFIDKIVYKRISKSFSKDNRVILGEPSNFEVIDNHLYILETDKYKLIKMDLSGKIVKSIKVKNILKREFPRKELDAWFKKSELDPKRGTFPKNLWPACWIIKILDGFAVGRREDYNPEDVSDWIEADYFDLDLNFKGRIKILKFSIFWNHPFGGKANVRSSIYFKNKQCFLIDRRDVADDEEYYITKWEVE